MTHQHDFGQIVYRDPRTLQDRPRNPKVHTVDQINSLAETIRELGFNDPIELDRDGVILAGHGRKQAAIHLRLEEVPVIYHDLSGPEADAYALVHNSTTLSTGMNMDRAIDQLAEAGLSQEDAVLAGISNEEWTMRLADSAGEEVALSGSSPGSADPITQAMGTGSPDRVRKVILRFSTEEEYQEFLRLVTWLRNMYPNEETTVARFQRFMDDDRRTQ